MTATWFDGEVLAFDLETTGVDKFNDVPVSFALVTMRGGEVMTRRHCLVNPGRPIPPGAAAIHGISNERAEAEGIELASAIEEISTTLLETSASGVPVVGFNLSYDLTMVDACSRGLGKQGLKEQGWVGPVLDPLVIDRGVDRYRSGKRTLETMCDRFGIENTAAHDAAADAIASALVLRALADQHPEVRETDAAALTAQQVAWHRTWAESFDKWLREKGRPGMDERDFVWPISGTVELLG